jgi:hypothetical protein
MRKRCSTCRRTKARARFYRQSKNRDGLTYQCKSCCDASGRESKRRRKPPPAPTNLVRLTDLARRWGVSRDVVAGMEARGEIASVTFRGHRRFDVRFADLAMRARERAARSAATDKACRTCRRVYASIRAGQLDLSVAKETSNAAGKIIKSALAQLEYAKLRKEKPNIPFLK